ncbi:hypothetical protein BJ875DRAFT_380982 [Amylocarpus encephaloides]|uniref:Uncharacterized protein n=1 Tax=Amylocarpus encephaloides TaxID=45428 RepID=A0A9P7YG01_9HELO|nr:hypothetical protein BJ875DRAFT_380982 [Amylocarpus encephaloides]
MPPKSKARAFNRAPKSKPAVISSSLAPKDQPPKPFTRVPEAFEQLLPSLSTNHVYITSIDSHPRDFKRKIFLVPVLMNIIIVGAIFYRISVIGPWYMKICFSLMGNRNELTLNTRRMTMEDLGKEALCRTATFMVDLLIYSFVWPWPKTFFLGQAIGSPVAWRTAIGFRDREIVIRRSRKWFLPGTDVLDEGVEQSLLFQNVAKATNSVWMNEKTGYLMLNKEWDLDWKIITTATKMADKGVMKLDDFKTTVLVHSDEFGWLAIESGIAGGSAKEEEGRKKIIAFKDELTAMGKENLFFRWIEIVQYESSQPGGFGPEQQRKAMSKARDLFEKQGVDFDKFWAKIGGLEHMPGMDDM